MPNDPIPPQILPNALTLEQVSKRLAINKNVVRCLIRNERLVAIRYNRKTVRVTLNSLEEYEKREGLFRIPLKPSNHSHTAS